MRGKGDIQVRIERKVQTMKNVLYVSGINVNLLSIIALDRRGFLVTFGNQTVKVIDKRTNKVAALGRARNGLYELNDCTSNKAFVTHHHMIPARETLPGHKNAPLTNFELMHQRLDHAGAYRLKDLHLHAHEIKEFAIPKEFQCETCNATKIIQTINKEPRTKTTIPEARMHTDV